VEASPRGKARLRFPVRTRPEEFTLNFPHNVHQDVIALQPRDDRTTLFVSARFEEANPDDKKPTFNSCAICHQTASNLPAFTARKPVLAQPLLEPGSETLTANAEFFKNSPESHASCFNCHYQGQKPFASDCASCHVLTSSHFDSNVISRYSLKFNHEHKDHNNTDCVSCHIRITQSSDLRLLTGADVPILTCSNSSCHNKDLKAEIDKRNKSLGGQTVFQCNYCHTSAIGSYQIPISHQAIK
jgi:cytochrome c2